MATIASLGFFGEGALIAGEEIELCNATVTVSSEKCVLLRLKRTNFLKLMKTNTTFTRTEDNNKEGDDNKSIVDQMKETRRERSQLNQMLMQNRNSSDLLGSGGSTNTRSLFYDSGLAVVYARIVPISNTSTTGVDS